MNDEEILGLIVRKDEQGLSEVKTKYGGYIRHICAGFLPDDRDREECENDVFFALWTSPPSSAEKLRPYIASLCRNAALHRIEKSAAEKRKAGQTSYEELEEILGNDGEGKDFADLMALKDALNRFLRGLSRSARVIFLQKYWYMRSVEEISRDTGMKENAVKASLFRTRKKLLKFLKEEGFEL